MKECSTPSNPQAAAGICSVTDEKLYELCKRYGTSALLWRQKFTGLLPEVNRRRLYERKGFSSIFEFAARLCGLSQDQVHLALNLEKRFEKMPTLKKMLEDGEVSINKLTRVASIATVENQEELAEKVKILPVSALNTLVKDEKFARGNPLNSEGENGANLFGEIENQNGLSKPLFDGKSLYVQTLEDDKNIDKKLGDQTLEIAKRSLNFGSDGCAKTDGLSFQLAEDVKKELEELNSKGIDVNEFLRKALKQRKEEIEERKEEIARELEDTKERNDAREPSRYIPAKVKKIIKEEYGTKCSIPNCQKQAEVLHHTQKFGLAHSHDPRFLAPLCHEHHLIAHSIDVKLHEIREGAM
jgi:hypothetical protein